MKIMAVQAHPDDESSKGAATLAKYALEGHVVEVVTLTGGERGDVLNPELKDKIKPEEIGEFRVTEMENAAKILHIEHKWLGFKDSGFVPGREIADYPEDSLARTPFDEPVAALVKEINRFKPDVVITYDENGGYPHIDHILCNRITLAAVDKSKAEGGWKVKKVYYVHGFMVDRFEKLGRALENAGGDNPFAEFLSMRKDRIAEFPDLSARVTTRVNVADYFELRNKALLAHKTQIDPNSKIFFGVPLELEKEVWPTEEFELVESTVPVNLPETDLLSGLF